MAGFPEYVAGQHNARTTAGDNTGQNTDKAHTLSPRKKIKLSDPTGNRTRAVGLKGRAFAEYATAMDNEHLLINNMKGQWEEHISHIFHFFFQ